MKSVVTALALATLIATPVLAQTPKHPVKQPAVQAPQPTPQIRTSGATDPDAFIRDMLRNDSPNNTSD
jgi:hypothetical protein